MSTPSLLLRLLSFAALVLAACAPAAVSAPSPSANAGASGVYVYQPAPLIWQLVTLVDGEVSHGAGAVFEWSCAGQSWTIGTIPASVQGTSLRFGDETFAAAGGAPLAPWHPGTDPRGLPKPICADATPTTKTVLSADAARELIKRTVTGITPVLVPSWLPDRVSATVETRQSSFTVTYVAADGVRVTLQTVVANPQPVRSDGTQRRLAFRGDGAAFYQALDGSAKTTRTLLWNESVSYALITDGLTETEFWKVAESLQ
jgi:hypothetical protein